MRALDPDLPIVVMTAWSSVPLAVTIMREGAGDFVEKPWDNARLLSTVRVQVARGRQLGVRPGNAGDGLLMWPFAPQENGTGVPPFGFLF